MHHHGTCRSCSMRWTNIRKNASVHGWGKPDVHAGRPTWAAWTPLEDRIIRENVGVLTIQGIIGKIIQDVGQVRTENAAYKRMQRLGIPRQLPGYSIGEIQRIMGVSYTVAQQWVNGGLIGPPNPRWTIAAVRVEDLERFVREHTELYDWKRITDPQLRSIGRAAWVRDPWMTVDRVAYLLHRCPEYVRRLFSSGTLPAQKVPEWSPRPGGVRWVVRRSVFTRCLITQPHLIGPRGRQDDQRAAS